MMNRALAHMKRINHKGEIEMEQTKYWVDVEYQLQSAARCIQSSKYYLDKAKECIQRAKEFRIQFPDTTNDFQAFWLNEANSYRQRGAYYKMQYNRKVKYLKNAINSDEYFAF